MDTWPLHQRIHVNHGQWPPFRIREELHSRNDCRVRDPGWIRELKRTRALFNPIERATHGSDNYLCNTSLVYQWSISSMAMSIGHKLPVYTGVGRDHLGRIIT